MMRRETLANVNAGFLAVLLRNLDILIYLTFVPCIIRRSRNNHHNAQICTNVYAIFWLLHVSAVVCHLQGASGSV
jgi:hypothetical protein